MLINEKILKELQKATKEEKEKFFIKNINFIKAFAFNLVRKKMRFSDFEDCVQQVFVDMYNYDYTSERTFFKCLFQSFYKTLNKTLIRKNTCSLEETIKNTNGLLLEELISDTRETEEEQKEHYNKVIDIIKNLSNLTPNEKDNLLAFSFGCSVYKGIFKYAQTQTL